MYIYNFFTNKTHLINLIIHTCISSDIVILKEVPLWLLKSWVSWKPILVKKITKRGKSTQIIWSNYTLKNLFSETNENTSNFFRITHIIPIAPITPDLSWHYHNWASISTHMRTYPHIHTLKVTYICLVDVYGSSNFTDKWCVTMNWNYFHSQNDWYQILPYVKTFDTCTISK